MRRNWDTTLQVVFVLGLMALAALFYLTRISNLRADDVDRLPLDPYAVYDSVYQFEQEERRLQTVIAGRKADYASAVATFIQEKASVMRVEGLSTLEKREKMEVLEALYTENYFQRKLDLIDQEQLQLKRLLQLKCAKFCVYQDLPVGDVGGLE